MKQAAPIGPASHDYLRAEQRLLDVELTVVRRVDGLLQGHHRGRTHGSGSEPGEGRQYRFGDDVRRMDWKLTARSGTPHVREAIADRELDVWLVVDTSRSLEFGTTRFLKRDLALGAAATIGFLSARSGSRVGAIVYGSGDIRVIPSRTGRSGVRAGLLEIDRCQHSERGPESGLAAALERVQRVSRRQGPVFVISDFHGDLDWERALRGLRHRHDLVAFELLDPLELELPELGIVRFEDPETGRSLEVHTSRRKVRREYARRASVRRDAVLASLRRCATDHVLLRTDEDWMRTMATYLGRRKRTAWLSTAVGRASTR